MTYRWLLGTGYICTCEETANFTITQSDLADLALWLIFDNYWWLVSGIIIIQKNT